MGNHRRRSTSGSGLRGPVRLFGWLALMLAAMGAAGNGCDGPPPPPPGQYEVTANPIGLNQPPDPFVGRVTPAADAAERGMFAATVDWPIIAIHAALTAEGRLLSWGTAVDLNGSGGIAFVDTSLVDAAHTVTPTTQGYDAFCNGLGTAADGRLVMVGGNSSRRVQLYNPATRGQTVGPAISDDRWYATVLRRPDGQLLLMGGAEVLYENFVTETGDDAGVAITPEIGDGITPWRRLEGATSSAFFGAGKNRWWYPRAYNAPDGRVFGVSFDRLWWLDSSGEGRVSGAGTLPFAIGSSGSSVMYDRGKLLFAGGGQVWSEHQVPATTRAAVVDINGANPQVAATGSMAAPRHWLNLTVMANGEVVANGGTRFAAQDAGPNAVFGAEIWNPATGAWRPAAAAARVRTYHSTSLLLPSGAVWTGGGGKPGPVDNLNAEWFLPPYLFDRSGTRAVWADRPAITSIAGSLDWGATIDLGLADSRPIAEASLISVGNVTHALNVDQRRIPLTVSQSGTNLRAWIPARPSLVPPGSYLLQVVDADGVPSPSHIVTFHVGRPGTVTVAATR